ncbi:MAG TPA: choice-of-anchor D domain-containing protein, partial [Candidatus Dormibacteraeota bacterium]|nr:choice-of-anchor D domain-containing protein [Candidatus Dormibacteraeota bacterium]
MKSRGHWGARCWRAVGSAALLVNLAIPQLYSTHPLVAAAATAAQPTARPELSTYAGQPATGAPKDVAQQPYGLAVFGRYTFVADPVNHVVRLLIDNSEVTFTGVGGLAVEGDGADPAKAQLAGPYAVAIGQVTQVGYDVTAFDVYIADTFGHQIRKVHVTVPPVGSPGGPQTAVISTVAGTGAFGLAGDNGSATAAQMNSPYGVAWDKSQNLVYVADTLNNCIRSVQMNADGTPGNITTAVGPCSAPGSSVKAPLNHPRGLASDGNGKLYIADTYNNVVRLYDAGTEYTPAHPASLSVMAGAVGSGAYKDGVVATNALLKLPSGVALDDKGNLFIADTGNNVIREVTSGDGIIRTVAGTTERGDSPDSQPAILSKLNTPMAVAIRPNGDVVIGDTGNNRVRILEATLTGGPAHNMHIEAGNGTASLAGNGQPPSRAQFAGPAAVVSDMSAPDTRAEVPPITGQRYIVDTFNNAIRTFHTADTDPSNHSTGDKDIDEVSTLLGNLRDPMGAALDSTRHVLYISDTFDNVVRAIDLIHGTSSIVAGNGQPAVDSNGLALPDPDGQSATQESLSYPTGLAVDSAGDLFIADTYHSRVREVIGGRMYTVAGTGTVGFSGENGLARSADLYFPYGVAIGTSPASTLPDLYITDSFNHRVRKVTAVSPTDHSASNIITTVAGTADDGFADGATAQAQFKRPWSASVDQAGAVYVADYLNHRLRRVDPTAGTVTTLAGKGTAGLLGDVGPADSAELSGPRSVSLLADSGAMLIADSFNNRVRWFGLPQAGVARTQVNFDPTNLAGQSQPQSVTVTSSGSGLLTMGNVDLGADRNNFYLDPQQNTCVQARLEPGASCFFQVAFQPQALGGHTGSVVIPNDAIGGPQLIMLTGQATASLVGLNPPAVAIYQPVNSATASSAAVTMTNNGDGPLTINSIALERGANSDFSQSYNCPGTMLGHTSCQITITLNPISASDRAARTDRLVIKDDASGNSLKGGTTQFVPLTGSLAQAAASFNHQSLTFAQNLGTASAPETFMLVNSGQTPLHLSGIHEDGDFSQTNNCPPVLAPGASCAINVTFVPSTLGERDGYIVIADDSVDSPQRIQVMGVGTMALVQLGPDHLSFSQNVGAVTPPQMVNLTNHGDGPLTIGGIAATGDFKAQSHCPPVLLPGISCSIGVTFAPLAGGTRTGTLIVNDDAGSAPGTQQSVRLNGYAYQAVASLSATSLSPGANLGGYVSTSVTLTNTGDGALNVTGISIGGGASGDYSQSSTCLRIIQPGASCSITVNFTPHGYGLRAATLVLSDDGAGGSQSIALRGTGTSARPVLSSGYLNFGGDRVGNPTVPQTVVLFNSGNGALSITNMSVSGPDFQMSSDCG